MCDLVAAGKEIIMIHTDNFWAQMRRFGGLTSPKGRAYFALTERRWRLEDLPEADMDLAKVAEIPLTKWLEIKADVWPKIVDHDEERFWADEKRADEVMEEQARESAEAELR